MAGEATGAGHAGISVRAGEPVAVVSQQKNRLEPQRHSLPSVRLRPAAHSLRATGREAGDTEENQRAVTSGPACSHSVHRGALETVFCPQPWPRLWPPDFPRPLSVLCASVVQIFFLPRQRTKRQSRPYPRSGGAAARFRCARRGAPALRTPPGAAPVLAPGTRTSGLHKRLRSPLRPFEALGGLARSRRAGAPRSSSKTPGMPISRRRRFDRRMY